MLAGSLRQYAFKLPVNAGDVNLRFLGAENITPDDFR